MNAPRLAAYIFARGGSKGLSGKALLPLGAKPVIAHTIEAAFSLPGVQLVHVNTDDPAIAEASRAAGADVPFLRPAHLATDTASLSQAHSLTHRHYWDKGFVAQVEAILFPTYPFRQTEKLSGRYHDFLAREEADAAFGVAEVPGAVDIRLATDRPGVFSRLPEAALRAMPERVFHITGNMNFIHVMRPGHTRRLGYPISQVEAIDLDEPVDYALAQAVLDEGLAPGCALGDTRCVLQSDLGFLGKRFDPPELSSGLHLYRHPDFPGLTDADVERLTGLCRETGLPAFTARRARVHPYRLASLDEAGFVRDVLDIPQELRGHRQAYPLAADIVPAAFCLPPSVSLAQALAAPLAALLVLPAASLFDHGLALERSMAAHLASYQASTAQGGAS